MRTCHAALSTAPIDIQQLLQMVAGRDRGGIVTFCGGVGSGTDGEISDGLVYEADEKMAESKMIEIVNAASSKWDANICCEHRIGELAPGENAVVVVAACVHRAEAFDACRYVIDQVKAEVPIWKKELGGDWVKPGEVN